MTASAFSVSLMNGKSKETGPATGLSGKEARDHLARYGYNEIKEEN